MCTTRRFSCKPYKRDDHKSFSVFSVSPITSENWHFAIVNRCRLNSAWYRCCTKQYVFLFALVLFLFFSWFFAYSRRTCTQSVCVFFFYCFLVQILLNLNSSLRRGRHRRRAAIAIVLFFFCCLDEKHKKNNNKKNEKFKVITIINKVHKIEICEEGEYERRNDEKWVMGALWQNDCCVYNIACLEFLYIALELKFFIYH